MYTYIYIYIYLYVHVSLYISVTLTYKKGKQSLPSKKEGACCGLFVFFCWCCLRLRSSSLCGKMFLVFVVVLFIFVFVLKFVASMVIH